MKSMGFTHICSRLSPISRSWGLQESRTKNDVLGFFKPLNKEAVGMKTVVRMDGLARGKDGKMHKKHYKSATVNARPHKVWNAFANGCSDVLKEDINETRSQRLRKGGGKRKQWKK
jgi:hypothetical protein